MRQLRSLWRDRLLRTVLENSGYLFSSNTATMVLSMAQSIFAARLLGGYGFGLLTATVIPFISTINRLLSFRMSELVVKYMRQFQVEGDRAKTAAVVKGAVIADIAVSVLGYLLLAILAPLAANLIAKDPQSAPLFYAYGAVLLVNATYETATGVLQAANRFRMIAIINLVQSMITASLILIAYLGDRTIVEVMLAYIAGKTFSGLTTTIFALFELRKSLGDNWWQAPLNLIPDWRPIRRFALSTNLSGTLKLITRDSESLWVAFFRSPVEAGYFKIALAGINLLMMPIQPFIGTTYTEIARIISERFWDQTTELLRKVSLIAGSWTIFAGGILGLFGSWLIQRFYGAEFAPAYPALLILLLGYGCANTLYWNRTLLLALGLPTYPLKVDAAVGLVKIGLAFVFVPRFGFLAQAALLTGFFLITILLNARRGTQELRRREIQPRLSEVGVS